MNLTKNILKLFFYFCYLLIITIFILELIFRFLPVSDSSKLQEVNNENPILKYKPSRIVTKQTGFNFTHVTNKKVNDAGYYSNEDYFVNSNKNYRTAIIGDSMVAAAEVENHESLSGLLMGSFENTKFYSIGIPGASLSQYLAFTKWSEEKFNPDNYIFVIQPNDFDESFTKYRTFPGHHYFNDNFELVRYDYKPDLISVIARESALIRYLYLDFQLTTQINRFFGTVEKEHFFYKDYTENHPVFDDTKDIIRYFLLELRKITKSKPILFILDADRGKIYNFENARGELWSNYVNFSYNYFAEVCCKENNYSLIDLYPVFEKHYRKNKIRFEWEYDWHWNQLANSLVFNSVKKSKFLEKQR